MPILPVGIKLITCTYVLVFKEKECSKYEFNCGNGTCINKTRLCDGIDDCRDNGADEDDCGTFEIIIKFLIFYIILLQFML